MTYFSLKSKLILIFMAISLIALGAMAYLSWRTTQSALFAVVSTHLTTVRTTQANQVHSYFDALHSQIRTLAESEMTAAAVVRFRESFQRLANAPVAEESASALERYYTQHYLPALDQVISGTPTLETYRPRQNAAKHLQAYYVVSQHVANQLQSPHREVHQADARDYAEWHTHYDKLFHNLKVEFGYADLLLVDHETGDIVYTVQKNPDLGMNLAIGPYRQSHLARVVQAVQNNPERGIIQSIDFAPYRPQLGEPVAFLASAIYDKAEMVGILVIQLSLERLNGIMTNNGEWTALGLGKTGESYLVGPDQFMRTVSRYLQAETEYEVGVQTIVVDPSTRGEEMSLAQAGSSTSIEVDTEMVQAALQGNIGTGLLPNYLGSNVLSAFAPLAVDGVHWAILAEIAETEIMQPVYRQQRTLMMMLATLTLLTSMLMILFASLVTRPLARLISATENAVNGDLDRAIQIQSNDEFTQLSDGINQLVAQVRTQTNLVDEKGHQYDALLQAMLPPPVAQQFKQSATHTEEPQSSGGPQIVNRVQQVTVLSATLVGLTELNEESTPDAIGHLLNTLMSMLHETSQKFGLDAPLMIGDQIVVVCGLTTPRLDHAKRTVDFAQEMVEILKRVNEQSQTQLQWQVGIHSGTMTAGVLGGKIGQLAGRVLENQRGMRRFNYNLWGKPLNVATHLSRQAGPNVVLMSRSVFERVEQLHALVEYRSIDDGNDGRMMTWALASSLRMAREEILLIQMTFAKILPISDEVAEQFYARLFDLDPTLRPFFKADMREQQRKLMATLQVVIGGLANPEKILPAARDLGRRHVAYGVRDAHYDTVGEALLWTLAQGLGEEFTPEVQHAWGEMYERISSTMKLAAADSL